MIKTILLSLPHLWELEMQWGWSQEMDYMRSPRQFWKHKIYKDAKITHIYRAKPLSKSDIIKVFMHCYKNNDLTDDDFCVVTHQDLKDIKNHNYKKKI